MKTKLLRGLTTACIFGFLIGCAHIAPGNDPIVVRAEQLSTTGKATLDLVVNIDQADRGFWRTNAPAFHEYCEWLRTPTQVDTGETFPRGRAILFNLDEAKQAYAKRGGSTNLLWSSIVTATTVINQAGAWSTIVTNAIHP